MSTLPDPTETLSGPDLLTYEHMAAVRGEGALQDMYVRMYNNPNLATLVGNLGEHLRYHGRLPDDLRELVILHVARRSGSRYVWSHHIDPARACGLDATTIEALGRGEVPGGLTTYQEAALAATDHVLDLESIPAGVQDRLSDAFGAAGVVEVCVLAGLYRLIAGFVIACDIEVESGFPEAPF